MKELQASAPLSPGRADLSQRKPSAGHSVGTAADFDRACAAHFWGNRDRVVRHRTRSRGGREDFRSPFVSVVMLLFIFATTYHMSSARNR